MLLTVLGLRILPERLVCSFLTKSLVVYVTLLLRNVLCCYVTVTAVTVRNYPQGNVRACIFYTSAHIMADVAATTCDISLTMC
jgi:hypothetical protein